MPAAKSKKELEKEVTERDGFCLFLTRSLQKKTPPTNRARGQEGQFPGRRKDRHEGERRQGEDTGRSQADPGAEEGRRDDDLEKDVGLQQQARRQEVRTAAGPPKLKF